MKRVLIISLSSLLLVSCASFNAFNKSDMKNIVRNANDILYSNTFDDNKGYIDPSNSWTRNFNWPMTGGSGDAIAAQTHYVSNTNDVFVDDGELVIRESANYHYVETMAVLPNLSTLEGWDNNYIIECSMRFLDWNSSYSQAMGTTGFNILNRVDLATSGNVYFNITPPKATQTNSTIRFNGRRASGALGQLSGNVLATDVGNVDLTDTIDIRVSINNTGSTTSFSATAFEKTITDTSTLAAYYKNHATGNRIAFSTASCSVAISNVKVTSIDGTKVFYDYDFSNGSHKSFWDGWSTYGMSATGFTDGSYYIDEGKLHLDALQENYESFKNEVVYLPNEYKDFQLECDVILKDSFEPSDGVFDKYFGLVFSGNTEDKNAGKFGSFVFRKNGKIDLLSHESSESRKWNTVKGSIRAANVEEFVYGDTYHIVLSIKDKVLSMSLLKSNVTKVTYTSSFKGYRVTPMPFEAGRVGFLANSCNFSIDNLVIYSK